MTQARQMINASSASDIHHAPGEFQMPLVGVHSARMLMAGPSELKRHCSVAVSPELVPGVFAVSPTEWTVFLFHRTGPLFPQPV